MDLVIKQYKFEKVETDSRIIRIPTEESYFFETGVRRSIRIIPHFTTWNKERFDKDEELYELEITCLYGSFECRIEHFKIRGSDIESIAYSKEHKYKSFVTSLIEDWFDKRTKEQFEGDLKELLTKIIK